MTNWYESEMLSRLREAKVRKNAAEAWMHFDAIQKNRGCQPSLWIRGIRTVKEWIRGKKTYTSS